MRLHWNNIYCIKCKIVSLCAVRNQRMKLYLDMAGNSHPYVPSGKGRTIVHGLGESVDPTGDLESVANHSQIRRENLYIDEQHGPQSSALQ
jgi:hypothetical protein